VVRLSVRVVVSDGNKTAEYAADPRVKTAYKQVMMDITELPEDRIAVQMIRDGVENITVTYILSLPYVEGENGTLVPVVTLESVNAKLAAVNYIDFNQMVDQKVDLATGSGTYDQKVVAFEKEGSGEDGATGVSGTSMPSAAAACMMAAVLSILTTG